jgi:hypothetical protein
VITVLKRLSNRVGLRNERRIIPEDEAESSLRPTPASREHARMAAIDD